MTFYDYYLLLLSVRSVAAPTESVAGFDDMVSGTERKYYMLGGKGGVGKTSCAASLAVKFANNGHPTLVVSTDPAHSLSDSFAQVHHMPSSSDVPYVLDASRPSCMYTQCNTSFTYFTLGFNRGSIGASGRTRLSTFCS